MISAPGTISLSQGRTKRWVSQATAWGANWRRKDVTNIFGNIVLVNSGSHTRKNSPKIIRNLGTGPQKYLPAQSKAENLKKKIGLKGRQVINLPTAPTRQLSRCSNINKLLCFFHCVPPTTSKMFGFLLNGTLSNRLTICSYL